MNIFDPSYFIHAANVLLLVAYSVRDILWLRSFAVAAALISIPYFALQQTPLWEPLAWTDLFAAINGFQSWRLFVERRPRLPGFAASESLVGSEHWIVDHRGDGGAINRAWQMYRGHLVTSPWESAGDERRMRPR